MNLKAAVEQAVNESIAEGILKDFLLRYRQEAIQVSIFEYDEEETIKQIRECEFIEGKAEGKVEGKVEYILELLSDLGSIPESLRQGIAKETNLATLKKWFKAAAKAETIEDFQEKTGL